MKRRVLSAVFSVALALSVFGNAVYASEPESAVISAVAAEETDVNPDENAESEETEQESSEESAELEETEEESQEKEEESSEESAEPEETEQVSSEESTEAEETEEVSSEESTETEGTEEESTEESAETEEIEEETEENFSESPESEESEETVETSEEFSEEEINGVYYAATSDGWSFTVNNDYATITGYTGDKTVLNIPTMVKDNITNSMYKVTAIGDEAFAANGVITEVILPDSVTCIGSYAFRDCSNLKKIELGNGIIAIDEFAFTHSGIRSIIFPYSVESIGNGVFFGCDNLVAIEVDCKVNMIPFWFAEGCDSLTSVVLGGSVKEIDGSAFQSTPRLKAISVTSNLNGISYPMSQYYGTFKSSGLQSGGTLYCPKGSWAEQNNTTYIGAANVSNTLPTISKPQLEIVEDSDSRGVLMSSNTEGAIIYYSLGSSAIDLGSDCVSNGNGVDFTYSKGTLYARAYLCGQWSDTVSITLPERKLAQPTFTVKGVFGGRDVTFSTEQSGAVIYYSTKGSTDITTSSAKVNNGQTVLFENFYGSVYAKSYYDGHWSNASRLILKIPVVNDPVITYSGDKVTIKTTTPDAYIYYTTDGSTPSINNGKRLSGSGGTFTLPGGNGTVKAIAVRSCFTNSQVVTKKVTPVVDSSIKVPSFQVKGVIGGRTVTFNTAQPGAVIYYSTTTSTITTLDQKVTNGGSVTFTDFYGTVYARTYYNGKWSNVAKLILKIPVVNQPTITYSGSGYYNIRTTTPNCTIYYTTDGTTPSPTNGRRINGSSGRVYGGYGTVKAIAVRSCFTNSSVKTYYY